MRKWKQGQNADSLIDEMKSMCFISFKSRIYFAIIFIDPSSLENLVSDWAAK